MSPKTGKVLFRIEYNYITIEWTVDPEDGGSSISAKLDLPSTLNFAY